MTAPKLRMARPTGDLNALLPFYVDGLGLEVLSRFDGHDGIDGIMLGKPGWPYHLEFTQGGGHSPPPISPDALLVFYLPDAEAWSGAVARMREAGFDPVASANPYWDVQGLTFEDPEGARIVLQNAVWPS